MKPCYRSFSRGSPPRKIAGRGALSLRCGNPERTSVALIGSFGIDFLLEP